MGVAKMLRIRGFAAAGISVACMLAAACLAAGVPCNQVAYASETESQSQTANAQNAQSSSYLYGARFETNLWGFVDAAGTQVIPMPVRSLGSLPGQSPSSCDDVFAEQRTKSISPDFGCAYMICRAADERSVPCTRSRYRKWGYIDKSANGLSSRIRALACSAMGLACGVLKTRVQVS